MDLSTTYLGLKLRTPLVMSASPLSENIDNLKHIEDAGEENHQPRIEEHPVGVDGVGVAEEERGGDVCRVDRAGDGLLVRNRLWHHAAGGGGLLVVVIILFLLLRGGI